MSLIPLAGNVAGLPLVSMPAIVIDTETTGLDIGRDRIIEIGAVRLPRASELASPSFASFVDPNEPIPAASTSIHGISDADVVGAPDFSSALTQLTEWAGPAVLIGYSVGFDLAIIEAECRRAGRVWQMPRTLDVRHLIQIVASELPDTSLETAAEWLGIEVSTRHRALADAALTADVFEALLPRLRAKGIRTLGEVELAVRQRASLTSATARIGWNGTAGVPTPDGERMSVLSRIDSFPYRHRVADLMSAPALEITPDRPLSDALAIMMDKKVSSLFVGNKGAAVDYGIITERDVLRLVARDRAAALDLEICSIASTPLIVIGHNDFVYRALARMAANGVRHLGVTDESGALIGALSARDLLRQRADDAVAFGGSIERAATPQELGRIWLTLPDVVGALVTEGVDARDAAAVISRELRALTSRACEMAEAELAAQGLGPAPAAFGVMILGSGGRGESLLAMDQDNAIVHADLTGRPEAIDWFERFARRFSDILDSTGVSYCKGGVMASRPEWRMDEAAWRETVAGWMSRSRPQDILYCDIFFDALAIYGDDELVEWLRDDAIEHAGRSRIFLNLLALNAGNVPSSFGLFGRIKTHNGRVDLKRYGIMPIFSAARVGALRHGVKKRSTLERLDALRDLNVVAPSVIGDLAESHRIFFELVLRQQLRDLASGVRLSNEVEPGQLSRHDREEMIWALRRVSTVNDILGTPVGL